MIVHTHTHLQTHTHTRAKTLEPSDEDQKLLVVEDSEEVLKEKCPPQYTTLQEKDVSHIA